MKGRLAVLGLMGFAAMAQTVDRDNQPKASVSGVVRDIVTKQPLANFTVSTSGAAPVGQVQSLTDAAGRYRLSGLVPGKYQIEARSAEHFGPQISRFVRMAGQDVENIDINVPIDATISGKVLDENKEPVPSAWVYLVAHEYYLGSPGYFFREATRTDDTGAYTIGRLTPGEPYLVMAEQRATNLPPHSEAPVNPNFRKRVAMRTWYPNSPAREGAVPLVLRSGERRDGTDIEVKKSPGYCVDGVALAPGGAASMQFRIEALQPSSGTSSGGGMFVMQPSGVTGQDGKLRICDLAPGLYRVTVQEGRTAQSQAPTSFGVTDVLIKDEDLRDQKFPATSGLTLDGTVAWDTPPPETDPVVKANISLQPLLRTGFPGSADWNGARPEIPGPFTFENLFFDDYGVRATVTGAGRYIKEVTYNGRSVQHEPLRYGGSMQDGLRVVVGRDGGTISVKVADKDGNPITDARLVLFPTDSTSEGTIQATMVMGQTDQLGEYTSQTLRPGSYYVVATDEVFTASVESIAKLARSRTNMTKVDVAPGGSSQVTLEVVRLM